MTQIQHIAGETYHGRRGEVKNAFRYSIDYVLMDAEVEVASPTFFGRNAPALMSLWDTDHGGPPKAGKGASWARAVLTEHGIDLPGKIEILAQPRVLGYVFNPVSFWLCHDADGVLRAVIAEVTNTFGDRHSYLCAHADLREIVKADTIDAQKIFHVSPFQPVKGGYTFRFDITPEQIGIWIDYSRGNGGLMATLTGARQPLTTLAIVKAALRRPLGPRRVMGLIHWQALKLWWKGGRYRPRPEPPEAEVSR